ncbi:MAG: hypothetical protein WCF26_05580 [Candidatus Sulfotelmatobacter sp.]
MPLRERREGATRVGDEMIRDADHLMAGVIRVVAGLYKDGVVPKPQNYTYPFPNLLTLTLQLH